MLNRKMEQAINDQINAELYSAYLYLAMEAHFAAEGLPGFAAWMRVQTQEELFHAMKMYDFVHGRGGRVALGAIPKPPGKWKSPLDVFENVLAHEQKVTGLINVLVDLALAEKDHASHVFLQWFVTEQVEEEASAGEVLQKLRLIGKDANGLFVLDRELGLRTFTPPAQA
ncbi:MAG: ferritin [Desulfobacteraceae bacterium]|nr:ferritin [Desulfobacteraceae bacterium]